jgi:hypothetical protein
MKGIKGLGTRNLLLIGGGVIVVLLVAVGTLFIKYNDLKKTPDTTATTTSNRIIEKVSKIYVVPTNEQPTVALVQDKTKLNDQPFFKSAENGDYILVYSTSKLAMVYREQANKLVNVGPINITDDKTPSASTSSDNASGVAGASTDTTKH